MATDFNPLILLLKFAIDQIAHMQASNHEYKTINNSRIIFLIGVIGFLQSHRLNKCPSNKIE